MSTQHSVHQSPDATRGSSAWRSSAAVAATETTLLLVWEQTKTQLKCNCERNGARSNDQLNTISEQQYYTQGWSVITTNVNYVCH